MTAHDFTPAQPAAAASAPESARRGLRVLPPLVVMGVSGCGKSTVAQALAQRLGGRCIEGDDFHSPASIAKMSHGIALDDTDRWGWLDTLAHQLTTGSVPPSNNVAGPPVLACSALKRVYRDRLRASVPDLRFIWLDTPRTLLQLRLHTRAAHFMTDRLLDSQLATLEALQADENGLRLDASLAVADLVAACLQWLGCGD